MLQSKSLLLAGAAVLALAACEPMTEDNRRTQTGALTGAAIGGLIGATSNSSTRPLATVAGAAVGAAVGGAIGAQLDAQARELRGDLGNNVDVINTGNELIVRMPQDILFATDSATLRPDLQQDIRTVATSLQRYPNSTVFVVGHTDNTGSAAYNYDLSQRRAASVAAVLRNSGVAGNRLQIVGRGFDQPIASNATAQGRAQNRRVEIVIRPNT